MRNTVSSLLLLCLVAVSAPARAQHMMSHDYVNFGIPNYPGEHLQQPPAPDMQGLFGNFCMVSQEAPMTNKVKVEYGHRVPGVTHHAGLFVLYDVNKPGTFSTFHNDIWSGLIPRDKACTMAYRVQARMLYNLDPTVYTTWEERLATDMWPFYLDP